MLRHNNKYNPLTSRAMLSKSGGSVTVSRHLSVAEAAAGAQQHCKHQPPQTAASLEATPVAKRQAAQVLREDGLVLSLLPTCHFYLRYWG